MTTRIRTSTHPWTVAQEQELRRLARANMAPADIATRLSRTPEQVFERAHELGLTLPRNGVSETRSQNGWPYKA